MHHNLVEPFGIEGIVKHLKTNKAPELDDFHGIFMKKCWHIIKDDFLQLCNEFFNGKTSSESINGYFITMIPKKLSPENVNDF
jgi:hypothetical protein